MEGGAADNELEEDIDDNGDDGNDGASEEPSDDANAPDPIEQRLVKKRSTLIKMQKANTDFFANGAARLPNTRSNPDLLKFFNELWAKVNAIVNDHLGPTLGAEAGSRLRMIIAWLNINKDHHHSALHEAWQNLSRNNVAYSDPDYTTASFATIEQLRKDLERATVSLRPSVTTLAATLTSVIELKSAEDFPKSVNTWNNTAREIYARTDGPPPMPPEVAGVFNLLYHARVVRSPEIFNAVKTLIDPGATMIDTQDGRLINRMYEALQNQAVQQRSQHRGGNSDQHSTSAPLAAPAAAFVPAAAAAFVPAAAAFANPHGPRGRKRRGPAPMPAPMRAAPAPMRAAPAPAPVPAAAQAPRPPREKNFFCDYHKANYSHNTPECWDLQRGAVAPPATGPRPAPPPPYNARPPSSFGGAALGQPKK